MQVAVEKNDALDAGDLVVFIDISGVAPGDANPLLSTFDSGDEEEGGKRDQLEAAAAKASNALYQ